MLIQKKEVNSHIYLLLSLCSPPSQSHYFLIPIFPQSFRSTVADGVWPLCKRPMQEYVSSSSFIITFATFCDANDALPHSTWMSLLRSFLYFPRDLNILVMHFFFCSMFG